MAKNKYRYDIYEAAKLAWAQYCSGKFICVYMHKEELIATCSEQIPDFQPDHLILIMIAPWDELDIELANEISDCDKNVNGKTIEAMRYDYDQEMIRHIIQHYSDIDNDDQYKNAAKKCLNKHYRAIINKYDNRIEDDEICKLIHRVIKFRHGKDASMPKITREICTRCEIWRNHQKYLADNILY